MTQLQDITSKILTGGIHEKLLSYGVVHLSIFGSYARSEATKNSDLDILIDLSQEHGVTLSVLDEIETLLKNELSVPSVDIVTLRSLNPRLKPYIENDIITIF